MQRTKEKPRMDDEDKQLRLYSANIFGQLASGFAITGVLSVVIQFLLAAPEGAKNTAADVAERTNFSLTNAFIVSSVCVAAAIGLYLAGVQQIKGRD